MALTFTGSRADVGFLTDYNRGFAEVRIDGALIETVDTYSRDLNHQTQVYSGLAATTHTIEIRVAGARQPFAGDTIVEVDYIDVWNGTTLPDGRFEEDNPRLIPDNSRPNQTNVLAASASGGLYDIGMDVVWFPFSGDSIEFQVVAQDGTNQFELLVEGSSYLTFTRILLSGNRTIRKATAYAHHFTPGVP